MVAFVYDDVAVFADEILDFALAIQALDDRNINRTGPFRFSSADLADGIDRQIEERCQALPPLR